MRVFVTLALATAVAPQPAAGRVPQSAAGRVPQSAVADSILEARTAEIAKQLRCPVCQGLSIQDSPSELSQQMRAVVKDQLRAGKTPDEVKAYFISKYGEWILLEPKPHGFNILVYAMPIALVIVGLAVIFFAVRKWTRAPANPS
ncbi:MAG TPA: cytochrome c-type biogenesis protein [Gemmatimonadaceae bacterium]|jgi:cytochrome c-type biogenesis protein CcmH